jgi:polyphosphate kinase
MFCIVTARASPSEEAVVYIGSADLMPRNLDRRVEAMVPITNPTVHMQILGQIMVANLNDNEQSWEVLRTVRRAASRSSPVRNRSIAHRYIQGPTQGLSGRGQSLKSSPPRAISPFPRG